MNHAQPPKKALQFLRWFCRKDFLDEIEGNLVELFEKECPVNPTNARRQFILNTIRHFRPEYLKIFHQPSESSSFLPAMIANYIKLAFRNLRKKPSFSFINIFGLALGVCATLLILNYIDFETSYDDFHVKGDRLMRINRTYIQNNEPGQPTIKTTFGLGRTLAQDILSIKTFVRTHEGYGIVTYQPTSGQPLSFREDKVLYADTTFFDAFTFVPLLGDLTTALDDPNSIVITKSVWHKYFGHTDAIGKTLKFAGGYPNDQYTVTAVIEDVPANSHFTFNFVIPIHNVFMSDQYQKDDGWAWNNFSTYIELNDADSYWSVENELPAFTKRWMDPKWTHVNGRVKLHLQPLRNIHTEPGLRHDGETIGRSTIYFFGLIAVFILFIAWINYVNLSTARAMERSKEVGIKKAIGAIRSELVTQFLFESVVINLIAIVLAVGFAVLLLPVLANMIGKELPFHFNDARLWITLLILLVTGTLFSGLYPAFVLSSFRITKALKSKATGDRGFSLRKSLVVFQFASSLVLIAGTFVVYKQINYMQSQDKGLQTDQMLIVDASGPLTWEETLGNVKVFKEEIKKITGVQSIATSLAIPSGGYNWGADIRKLGEPESSNTGVSIVYVDPDFVPTYGIEFIAGHNFNKNSASDMKSVIINEAALKALKLGTADEALDQKLLINDTLNIIGVARNFNWNSLKSEVTPFVFKTEEAFPYFVSIRLEGGAIPTTLGAIEKQYSSLMPDSPFSYKFLDDSFNQQYKSDQQFGSIFGMFAGLAIAICCLGLWGLASFTTSQKLREIGIRKVLGASVRSIAYLLVRQFVVLIGLSAVIAIPLSWYGMNSWLNGFAFKIGVEWELFAIPVLILTLIALITISLQVRRGAIMNPVDVLKTE